MTAPFITRLAPLLIPALLQTLLSACVAAAPAGSPAVESAPTTAIATHALIDEAGRLGLASHPYWLGLLHYPSDGSGARSKVVSPEFFLAPTGDVDPNAELDATIRALAAPVQTAPDDHAQCRFPARLEWLRSQLDWSGVTLPRPHCAGFARWSNEGRIRSVGLVFATGYLKNPASFYGHILLRFNSGDASPILDTSLNYGAIFDERDSAPVYVFKGLTGRYEAGFTHEKFYKKNHEYGELELRDLWEYELNLSDAELDQLVGHSWELLGQKFRYYFTHENCATAMAELVELIIGQPLRDSRFPWVVPSLIFANLNEAASESGPRVADVTLHPSRQSRLHGRYGGLDGADKESIKNLTHRDPEEFAQTIAEIGIDRTEILDPLIDFYQIRTLQNPEAQSYKQIHQQLLLKRISAPPAPAAEPQYSAQPPHRGQRPTTVRTGPVHHSESGDGWGLQFRPVFFDLLSLETAMPAHAELSLMDLALAYYRGDREVRLERLEIFRATTLNVSKTDLRDEKDWAWSFRLAVEPHDLDCAHCLVPRLVGGLGKALRVGERGVLYVMGDLHVEESFRGSGSFIVAPRAGAIVTLGTWWKMQLEVGARESLDGVVGGAARWRWENRFGTGRAWDIRLLYEDAGASRLSTSLSIYF